MNSDILSSYVFHHAGRRYKAKTQTPVKDYLNQPFFKISSLSELERANLEVDHAFSGQSFKKYTFYRYVLSADDNYVVPANRL